MKEIVLGPNNLSIKTIENIVYNNFQIKINHKAKDLVNLASCFLEKTINSGKTIYGVNIGFGALSDKIIPQKDIKSLQENLLLSHACGVGPYFSHDIIKTAMILRIQNFLHGNSGIRLEVINRLIFMVNENIIPHVPKQGSVGVSGDLVPLSHVGITLLGKGLVYWK